MHFENNAKFKFIKLTLGLVNNMHIIHIENWIDKFIIFEIMFIKIKFDDKINKEPNNKLNQYVTKGYNALRDDLMKYLFDSWW